MIGSEGGTRPQLGAQAMRQLREGQLCLQQIYSFGTLVEIHQTYRSSLFCIACVTQDDRPKRTLFEAY